MDGLEKLLGRHTTFGMLGHLDNYRDTILVKTPVSNTAELYCLIVTLLNKDSSIVLDVDSYLSILKDYKDFPCSFSESDTYQGS